ncbi:MAG: FAD-dependent oxidoreductase, partial [Xanthobacteraceae bacterium]
WGMSCDEISADWAAQRIKGLDLTKAIINGLTRSLGFGRKLDRYGAADVVGIDSVKTLIESFQYPRKGPGMMWQAAAHKIAALGGQILMGRDLAAIEFDATRKWWRVEVGGPDGQRHVCTARHVVSSAPLRELVERIRPVPISLLHARALRYRDFLTVALMVRKQDLFPDNWIYIHDPSVKVGRVQNFRSWSPEMVPEGMSCLGLEYFCFEDDDLWSAPDSELIALAKKEIVQIGLVIPGDVVDACVVRQAKAYPVYDEGYADNVAVIRRDLEGSYPTLHVIGRNGMHRYNNQDHAMMTAMLTARNIIAGAQLYDVWNVNEDAEYHEAGESGAREALGSVRLVPEKAATHRAA